MKKLVVLVIFFSISLSLVAAVPSAQSADALFQAGSYSEALPLYKALHHTYPKNALYTYRLARCEQEEGLTDEAILHFEQAGSKYNLRNLYLGDLYYVDYRFADAAQMYQAYLSGIDDTHERYAEVQEQLSRAQKAQKILAKAEDICVFDSVFFPSSSLLSELPLSPEQGKFGLIDGNFTFCNQRADRRLVVVEEPQTGRHLICKQERLLDSWTPLDTLPEQVNMFAQQGYPFLMSDGLTLYFSAQSNQGLGEWDIYVTRYNSATDSWLNAELLNVPFNSIGNDYLYFIDETTGIGYFLTDRHAPKGLLSLYSFVPNAEHKSLRDSSDFYLRQFAQLNVLCEHKEDDAVYRSAGKTVEKQQSSHAEVDNVGAEDISVLITDTLVYSSLSAFRSEEARRLAAQYIQLRADNMREEAELAGLREQYLMADKGARTGISERILLLERTLKENGKRANTLLSECREKEISLLSK